MTRDELVADGLVNVSGAEAFAGIKKSLLYQLMERGELAYTKIGRRRLIPRRALVELAARGLRGADRDDPGR